MSTFHFCVNYPFKDASVNTIKELCVSRSTMVSREVYQAEGKGQRAALCALIKMYYCQGIMTHSHTRTNTES